MAGKPIILSRLLQFSIQKLNAIPIQPSMKAARPTIKTFRGSGRIDIGALYNIAYAWLPLVDVLRNQNYANILIDNFT